VSVLHTAVCCCVCSCSSVQYAAVVCMDPFGTACVHACMLTTSMLSGVCQTCDCCRSPAFKAAPSCWHSWCLSHRMPCFEAQHFH
jgi:hypothetical protein